jgi:Na+/phosphate symporter
MGTSLADKAWGKDSAVYRVSGVINVITGWFLTAITAFFVSGIIVSLIHIGGVQAIAIILFIILTIIGKNFIKHRNEETEIDKDKILKAESKSMKGVMDESSGNIIKFFKRVDVIYGLLVEGLSKHNLKSLKKGKKNIKRLEGEIEELRENIFYFIKNLEEPSLSASNFYIVLLSYIEDLANDLDYIVSKSFKHIDNDHQKLKLSQIRDLNEIHDFTKSIFKDSMETFDNNSISDIDIILKKRNEIKGKIQEKINSQIELTRNVETSPKNTTLYFNILLKSKDIYKIKVSLIEEFYNSYKQINNL